MNINVRVSLGELIDKISILSIKAERITQHDKHANVCYEHGILCEQLEEIKQQYPKNADAIDKALAELTTINTELWEVEDNIRDCEKKSYFGEVFINLARQVYKLNDKRSAAKYAINIKAKSKIVEEKQYTDYA
jgi:predicted nuclease with TOPRIM domain